MAHNIDFNLASSVQIEQALCLRLEEIRLARNITQRQLAEAAGVSLRTISRIAKGEGSSFDTIIRVMRALGIQQNLETLLPDPTVRPIERARLRGQQRQRARPVQNDTAGEPWQWGDSEADADGASDREP